jgi:hypothetical protein
MRDDRNAPNETIATFAAVSAPAPAIPCPSINGASRDTANAVTPHPIAARLKSIPAALHIAGTRVADRLDDIIAILISITSLIATAERHRACEEFRSGAESRLQEMLKKS